MATWEFRDNIVAPGIQIDRHNRVTSSSLVDSSISQCSTCLVCHDLLQDHNVLSVFVDKKSRTNTVWTVHVM
jgi:hypothetical protein